MTKTMKVIADNVDEEIKKYRALRDSAFTLPWNKTFALKREREKIWKKIEFFKKLKKACGMKK